MTTDLLGDPIPETPAMNAPLPWRVWQVNSVTEYVMARSEREAVSCYMEWCAQCGDYRTEAELRTAGLFDQLRELSDAELRDTTYGEGGQTHSFAHELELQAQHATVPKYFATTEY